MRDDRLINSRVLLRLNDNELFAVKWPEPESSFRAIMVEPSYEAFLPTRMVVQAIAVILQKFYILYV